MVDFVEVVGGHVGRDVGLDEDAVHWVGVADPRVGDQRHQARQPARRCPSACSSSSRPPLNGVPEMTIRVRDQGEGFDPETIADPLAPENLLKGSGRGIFLIRSFMDEVELQRAPQGGMEVRMVKRVSPPAPPTTLSTPRPMPHNPLFLTTAVEAVVRAGDMMMARVGGDIRVDKKGAIDLVTEVDVAIERDVPRADRRAVPRSRRARRRVGRQRDRAGRPVLGLRSDRRHDELRARPADLLLVAGARDRRRRARLAAIYDPNREELFTAERGGGAFLNGQPMRVSVAATLIDAMLVTGFPTTCTRASMRSSGCSASSSAGRAPSGGWARRPSTCATSRRAAWTGSGSAI